MLLTKQVIDGLNGIECSERNLNKDCVPIAHGTIPKSWQLKCLEFLAVLALALDESSGAIHEVGQIEGLTLVVLNGAYEVNGVEVSALGEHLHVFGIVLVNLTALENLQAHSAVLVIC